MASKPMWRGRRRSEDCDDAMWPYGWRTSPSLPEPNIQPSPTTTIPDTTAATDDCHSYHRGSGDRLQKKRGDTPAEELAVNPTTRGYGGGTRINQLW